ncbi:MAG: RING finger protein [Candidatus Thorarchaeota archaeon]
MKKREITFHIIVIVLGLTITPIFSNVITVNGNNLDNNQTNLQPNHVVYNVLSLEDFVRTDNYNNYDLIVNASDTFLNFTKTDPNSSNYHVDHVLPFAYCTNVEFFVTVNFEYFYGDFEGRLYFNMGYSARTPLSSERDDLTEIGFCRVSYGWKPGGYFEVKAYDDGGGGSKDSKEGIVPVKGEYIFHIKKANRQITCEILNLNMKRVFGRSWWSVNFFKPVNYLEITTWGESGSSFNISFTNLESTIDYGRVDWEAMRDQHENVVIGLAIAGSITILIFIMFIPFILFRFENRKKKNIDSKRVIQVMVNSSIDSLKVIDDISADEKILAMSITIDKRKLKQKKHCMICKLSFQERQVIFECPYCNSLFHLDHILDWLSNKDTCPVCGYLFD